MAAHSASCKLKLTVIVLNMTIWEIPWPSPQFYDFIPRWLAKYKCVAKNEFSTSKIHVQGKDNLLWGNVTWSFKPTRRLSSLMSKHIEKTKGNHAKWAKKFFQTPFHYHFAVPQNSTFYSVPTKTSHPRHVLNPSHTKPKQRKSLLNNIYLRLLIWRVFFPPQLKHMETPRVSSLPSPLPLLTWKTKIVNMFLHNILQMLLSILILSLFCKYFLSTHLRVMKLNGYFSFLAF